MKIAIFGATGFVGKALCNYCVQQGHTVRAFGRHPFSLPKLEFIQHDLLTTTRASFPSLQHCDVVYYLPMSHAKNNFPDQASEVCCVNTQGAVYAAEAACAAGCKFFCYASTGSVYTDSFEPLDENSPTSGTTIYSTSKIMAEQALQLFAPWMTVCSARIFAPFGFGQKNVLPSKIQEKIRCGETIFLQPSPQGDREGLRISYIYIDDLVRCLFALAENALNGHIPPKYINIAGEKALSIKEFAETLGSVLGKKPIFEQSTSTRKFDLIADIALLKKLYNISFTQTELAIQKTINFV